MKLALALLTLILGSNVAADGLTTTRFGNREDVQAFIREISTRHDWEVQPLQDLFDAVQSRPAIITALDKPSTSRPWYQFQSSFLTTKKIRNGSQFWRQHQQWLTRARDKFGVPEEIIVAIIGIETDYGRQTGRHRAIDALATIAFDYPRRADYFKQELEQFLLLTREEATDPLSLRSSYAGALGWPQFMPSSYRNYAVDFDGDGVRDIWGNPADVIGSIGYYFSKFGWRKDAPIALRASDADNRIPSLAGDRFQLRYSVAELQAMNITSESPVAPEEKAIPFQIERAPLEQQSWLGLNNFYVLTRYNKSINYAMAAFQLAEAIRGDYRSSQ